MIDIPGEALLFNLFYGGKSPTEVTDADKAGQDMNLLPVTEETPVFRNIHISNIRCKGAKRAMFFNGLPEMPVDSVTIKDVVVSEAAEGIILSHATNVSMENVKVLTKSDKPVVVSNCKNITMDGKAL
jgi:hypothetical protein